MAAKVTAQEGDISLAATWTGGLPAAGDTCTLAHACTLPTGKTFTAVSLDLAGFALVCTGVGTITADLTAIETLDESAATALLIDGDAETTVGAVWSCSGVTHITGALTCDGTGGTNITGLTNLGTLTVDGAITAIGRGTGHGVNNAGEIVGDITGHADDSGKGVYNVGDIVGAVEGTSLNDNGVFNGGEIVGSVEGTSEDSVGVYNTGTITGAVAGEDLGSGDGVYNCAGTINLNGLFVAASLGQALNNTGTIQSVVPAAAADVRLGTPCYTPSGPDGTLEDRPFQVFRIGG